MKSSTPRREDIVDRLADHLLARGLEGAGLRALAASAGTSDRMLLYYFTDKSELIAAVLQRIAERMGAGLGALAGEARLPPAALTALLWRAMRSAEMRPFMLLWLELAGRAGRGEEPYRSVGGAIGRGFLAWCAVRLELPEGGDAAVEAGRLVALVDGLFVLEAFGLGDVSESAADGG